MADNIGIIRKITGRRPEDRPAAEEPVRSVSRLAIWVSVRGALSHRHSQTSHSVLVSRCFSHIAVSSFLMTLSCNYRSTNT